MRRAIPLLVLFLSLMVGLSVGSVSISPSEILKGIFESDGSLSYRIVHDIRLPRVIMAGLVGAILSCVGAAFQNLLKNPLVDSYLIGVSAGASFGAVLSLAFSEIFGAFWLDMVKPMAFAFSLAATFMALMIAKRGRTIPVTDLILSGVAISSIFNALMIFVSYFIVRSVHGLSTWLFGNLSGIVWRDLPLPSLSLILTLSVMIPLSFKLDAMGVGEDFAKVSGVETERIKLVVLIVGILSVSFVVSQVGSIGFVGLVVPNALRIVFGPESSTLIPMSAIFGASFLILSDALSRSLVPPLEIPIGVLTSLVGVPIFLRLMRKGGSGW